MIRLKIIGNSSDEAQLYELEKQVQCWIGKSQELQELDFNKITNSLFATTINTLVLASPITWMGGWY